MTFAFQILFVFIKAVRRRGFTQRLEPQVGKLPACMVSPSQGSHIDLKKSFYWISLPLMEHEVKMCSFYFSIINGNCQLAHVCVCHTHTLSLSLSLATFHFPKYILCKLILAFFPVYLVLQSDIYDGHFLLITCICFNHLYCIHFQNTL